MKKYLTVFVIICLSFGLALSADAAKKKKRTKKGHEWSPTSKIQVLPKNQPTKKDHVVFKHFNENDPKRKDDNTVTVVKEGQEVTMPIKPNWMEKHLSMFNGKDVSVTSVYTPETGDYVVTNIEPF